MPTPYGSRYSGGGGGGSSGPTLQQIYPIGSLYIETTGTNPATTFGFGTWVAYAAGLSLVGVGTGTDSNSNTQTFVAATQVGEYKHTLAANEGSQPGFTTGTQSALHVHDTGIGQQFATTGGTNTFQSGASGSLAFITDTDTESATHTHAVAAAVAANGHNTVQPSMPVYVWHRTA